MAVNQNVLAKRIVEREGKRVSVSIAQVKEVLTITLHELATNYKRSEVIQLLEKIEDG